MQSSMTVVFSTPLPHFAKEGCEVHDVDYNESVSRFPTFPQVLTFQKKVAKCMM